MICVCPQSVIGFHPFYCFERKDNPTFIPGRSRYWYLLCKSNKSYSMTYQMAKSIKDMVSRDPKSGHKFKFSGGLIWIVLHYPKREQSLFIYLFLEMVHNKNKYSKMPASKLKLTSWLRISGNHIFSTGFIEQKK